MRRADIFSSLPSFWRKKSLFLLAMQGGWAGGRWPCPTTTHFLPERSGNPVLVLASSLGRPFSSQTCLDFASFSGGRIGILLPLWVLSRASMQRKEENGPGQNSTRSDFASFPLVFLCVVLLTWAAFFLPPNKAALAFNFGCQSSVEKFFLPSFYWRVSTHTLL